MYSSVRLVPDVSRREFCSQGCLSAAAVALGTLATGCGGSSDGGSTPTGPSAGGSGTGNPLATASATVSGRTVSVHVDGSPLAAPGGMAIVRTGVGNFLVARTGVDAYVALSAVCTHEGNTVSNANNGQFECPVHGSQFTVAGAVVRGPATRALTTYPVTFANGAVSFAV